MTHVVRVRLVRFAHETAPHARLFPAMEGEDTPDWAKVLQYGNDEHLATVIPAVKPSR